MGFRFWRRIKIAPGVNLNLSKSGISTSIGPRGAKYTVGSKGTRQTFGIPGTGLSYTTTRSYTNKQKNSEANMPQSTAQPPQSLNLGFFKNLTTPANEKMFIEGCKELLNNNLMVSLKYFSESDSIADSDFMAGILSYKLDYIDEARNYLVSAYDNKDQLGGLFNKYGIDAGANINITDEITAYIEPNEKGVLLTLAEIYQRQDDLPSAKDCLFLLRKTGDNDIIVLLSLIEIVYEMGSNDTGQLKSIVNLTQNITNETHIHAALLLYKAKALNSLGLHDVARDLLTSTLRRKKDRPVDLINALFYERALTYEKLGKKKQARNDFEKIYSTDTDYEDVPERLGLN